MEYHVGESYQNRKIYVSDVTTLLAAGLKEASDQLSLAIHLKVLGILFYLSMNLNLWNIQNWLYLWSVIIHYFIHVPCLLYNILLYDIQNDYWDLLNGSYVHNVYFTE